MLDLEAELAGVREHCGAVPFDMVVELDAGRAALQELAQTVLALLERLRPQVGAVELEQIERIEDRLAIVLTAVQPMPPLSWTTGRAGRSYFDASGPTSGGPE